MRLTAQSQHEADRAARWALMRYLRLLAYLTVRLAPAASGSGCPASAERVSDVIKRSTTLLHAAQRSRGPVSRDAHYGGRAGHGEGPHLRSARAASATPPSPRKSAQRVDKDAEACYGCHAQSQPLARLNRPDRFRIYRTDGGQRVLGIITPIENQPSCSNAACHAHPASQQILGVLDTNISLAKSRRQLWRRTAAACSAIPRCALLCWSLAELAFRLASCWQASRQC